MQKTLDIGQIKRVILRNMVNVMIGPDYSFKSQMLKVVEKNIQLMRLYSMCSRSYWKDCTSEIEIAYDLIVIKATSE
jgi:hypothetical protein